MTLEAATADGAVDGVLGCGDALEKEAGFGGEIKAVVEDLDISVVSEEGSDYWGWKNQGVGHTFA